MEVEPVLGLRRRAPGHEPHRLDLDRQVRDHERHGLAVADRLAERLAVVDVGDDVVEHRLRRADGQRRGRDARAIDQLRVVERVGAAAEHRAGRQPNAVEAHAAEPRRARAQCRIGLDADALGVPLHQDRAGPAADQLRRDEEQLGARGERYQRLLAVQPELAAAQRGPRRERVRVEQRASARTAEGCRRRGFPGERRQVLRLLLRRAPARRARAPRRWARAPRAPDPGRRARDPPLPACPSPWTFRSRRRPEPRAPTSVPERDRRAATRSPPGARRPCPPWRPPARAPRGRSVAPRRGSSAARRSDSDRRACAARAAQAVPARSACRSP